jgi:PAS domain S-box-containing protein
MEIDRGKKLLLVEDEAIISVVTAKMLKRSGYEVITASNGKKAVETALTDSSIDLILMDIDLGSGVNGPEAARQILETRNIPIVFLTSHSEQSIVESVKEITRYGYVIKNSGDFVLLSSIDMAFELFNSHERLKTSAEYLRLSEERVRSKLDSILSPDGDTGELVLGDVIDITMLQSLMDDVYDMTGRCMAIVDLTGNVLVAAGWQDICTGFHRTNSVSCRNCVESDTVLSQGIAEGAYKLYKCKNNMWDMATPVKIGGKHMGNLFIGQFLFNDEVIDYDLFRSQAKEYGFNEEEYIAALERVPRLGRDDVYTTMTFYIKLLNIISKLSYSNIKLARTLAERDRYSELHKESEERLSDVTEYMADLVARLDKDGFYKYVSPSFERVLGYRQDELVGTWAADIVHPADREQNIKDISDMCLKGEGSVELRQRHRSGTYRWFEVTGRNIYDENGIVTGAVLGARDITDRRIAEKKFNSRNKQYKDLFDNMIDGFAIHEIIADEWGNPVDYVFLEVNPAFESYTGLNPEFITGKRVTELIPDIEPYWITTYGQVAFTGVQLFIENYSAQLDKWFKVTAYSPERGYFATIFEDITDRKKSEDLLKERDERYKRLFESVVGYIYTVFIENGTPVKTVHGPGCEAVTGYTPEDFATDPELWYKMIYPDDRGRVVLFASDIINRGIFNFIEHRIICRDDSILWVRNTPVPLYDAADNLLEYDSIISDITERKVTETALKESEARYRLIVDNNSLSIMLVRNGRYIYANMAGAGRLGYKSPDEVVGIKLEDTLPPEVMPVIRERAERAMKGEPNPPMELTFIGPDGTECLTESASFPITLSDGPAILVMGQDITEKRRLQNQVAADYEKYKTIADFTYDWEFWIGPDGRMIYCSPSCERITGYTKDEFISDPFLLRRIVFPDDIDSPCIKDYEVNQYPEVNETEFRITARDGSVKWIGHVCRAVYDNAGNFTGRRGSNRDITEQKIDRMETEAALARLDDLWDVAKHADDDFTTICDNILSAIVRITKSMYGFYGFINDDETAMTIYSWSGEAMKDCSMPQKPQLYKISECGIWAEAVRLREDVIINDYSSDNPAKRGLPAGHVQLNNLMVIPVFADGKIKSVAAVANSEGGYGDNDRINMKIFLSNIQSVIQKRMVDEKLRDSEIKLKTLMNATTDGAFLMTTEGIVLEANKTLAERFGVTAEQMIGSDMFSYISPDLAASRRNAVDKVIKTGIPLVFEDERAGLILESNVYPIKNSTGEVVSIALFSRDITESKKAFETINSLLKEKDLLLSEVHHRIKNNMNTISGLLMLQAASMSDGAAVTALNDARSRVQSMMLMYDKLYRSEDYRKMHIKDYFEKFIDDIFLIFENSKQITIIKEIDDFILDTKTIFPVGIAINELITNAFKYAFPDGREGSIKVRMAKSGNEITLAVSDDGVGLPDEAVASKSGGFGLNLVAALAEQIGGEVNISTDNGTRVEIVFPVEV